MLLPPLTTSTTFDSKPIDHDMLVAFLRHYLYHSERLADLAQLSIDIFQRIVFAGEEEMFLSPRVWEWLRNWLIGPVITTKYHDLMVSIIRQNDNEGSLLFNNDDKMSLTKANKFIGLMAADNPKLYKKIFNRSFVTIFLPHAFGIDVHYLRLCESLSLVFPRNSDDDGSSVGASLMRDCTFLKWLISVIVGNGPVVSSDHADYEMRERYHEGFLRIYNDIWGTTTIGSNDALHLLSQVPHDGYPPFDSFITALCQVTTTTTTTTQSSLVTQNYFRHMSNVVIPQYITKEFKSEDDGMMMLRWLTILFQNNQTTTTSLMNDGSFLWDFHRHLLNRQRKRRMISNVCCYWFLCVIAAFVAEQQHQMGDTTATTKKDDCNNDGQILIDFVTTVIGNTPPEDFCEGHEPGSLYLLEHLEHFLFEFIPLTLKTVEMWTTVMVGIGYHFQDGDDDDDDNNNKNKPSDNNNNVKKHTKNDHRLHGVSTQSRRGKQQDDCCRTILFRIVDGYLNNRRKDTNEGVLRLFFYRVAQDLRAHGAERGYQWWTRKTLLVKDPDKKDQIGATMALNGHYNNRQQAATSTCRETTTTLTTNPSLVTTTTTKSPQTTTRRKTTTTTTTTKTTTTIAVKNNNKMSLLERLNDITKETTTVNSSITTAANNVTQKQLSSQGGTSSFARKRKRWDDSDYYSDKKTMTVVETIIKTPHSNNDNDQQQQQIHCFSNDATKDKMTTKNKNDLQMMSTSTTTTLSSPSSNEKKHDGILV